MQLKTILNRVQKIKSFVYGAVRWVEGAASPTLEVELHPRANGGRCVRAVGRAARGTTGCRPGASSSSRFGG